MNVAAAIAIAAGALGVYVGTLAHRLALAPGWGEQRSFGLVAYAAATYAFGNLATTLGWPEQVIVVLSHVQLAAVLFQVWAWFNYLDGYLGRAPRRGERRARHGLLALAALSLVPRLTLTGAVQTHRFPLLGGVYTDAQPSPLGEAFFAIAILSALVLLFRLVAAWVRGHPYAALHTLSMGALILFGVNDAIAASGLVPLPYLLDIGFVAPVGAVAWSLTARFAQDARALHELRGRLEALVAERTEELHRTQAALHQSEKLASLGQFAAGVAHQVNNPASVVTATLSYLSQGLAAGAPPEDAAQALREASEAMRRIAQLVRHLGDAGRLAAGPSSAGSATAVAGAVAVALAEGQARTGDRVAYQARVAPELMVRARPEVLSRILSALVSNAGLSIPGKRKGRVEVSATARGDEAVIVDVRDDGQGMTAEVLRHAFDPFYSTRPEGQGSGLGLPVARALAEGLGGTLELQSDARGGALARLTLPRALQEAASP